MHLHGLGILHGNITPVGKPRDKRVHTLMPNNAQNNILVTRDGQACVGEFGITGAFWGVWVSACELTTLRYMAPERFTSKAPANLRTGGPS